MVSKSKQSSNVLTAWQHDSSSRVRPLTIFSKNTRARARANDCHSPFAAAVNPSPPANPQSNGMGKNARCLRRDISNYLTSRYGRPEDIAALITGSANVGKFQDNMQSTSPTGGMGVHGVGHFTIAGDPGADFYNSPNDPAFWVHHGMIDRTWGVWQSQNLSTRTNVIAGGTSMVGFNTRLQSLDDPVDLGVASPDLKVYKIRDLVSTVDGPFCYTYE